MKPYERGMNLSGETAAQVASFLVADLRVLLRDHAGGQRLLDDLQANIKAAILEGSFGSEKASMAAMEKYGGYTSLVSCWEAWQEMCRFASEIDGEWLSSDENATDAMKRLLTRGRP